MFQSAVILIGSPGSGKTTIGALLASQLNRKAIDFDNDVLESYWGMPVAAKVSTVKLYGIILYAADIKRRNKISKYRVISYETGSYCHNLQLDEVGGSRFVEEEGKALAQFRAPANSVLSLSGSKHYHYSCPGMLNFILYFLFN